MAAAVAEGMVSLYVVITADHAELDVFVGQGVLVHSGEFDGQPSHIARQNIIKKAENEKVIPLGHTWPDLIALSAFFRALLSLILAGTPVGQARCAVPFERLAGVAAALLGLSHSRCSLC